MSIRRDLPRHELSLELQPIDDGRFQPRLPPVSKEELESMDRLRELLGNGAKLCLEPQS